LRGAGNEGGVQVLTGDQGRPGREGKPKGRQGRYSRYLGDDFASTERTLRPGLFKGDSSDPLPILDLCFTASHTNMINPILT
jgi:hypothetical protein